MSKVFVIDDSPSVCFAIESILTPKGIEVVSERSGKAAIAALDSLRPDLVLCDLVLPDIEGFQVCRHIKGHPRLGQIPIIVISGIVDDEVKEQAKSFRVEGVIKKPFSADDLLQGMAPYVDLPVSALPAETDASPQRPPAEAVSTPRTLAMPESPEAFQNEALVAKLHEVIEDLSTRVDLRFGAIANARGKLLESVGDLPAGEDKLIKDFVQVVYIAASLSDRSGYGGLQEVILEGERGPLVIHPFMRDYTLVIALRETTSLGMARYVLRQVVKLSAEV